MKKNIFVVFSFSSLIAGCSFNFEITSQKTALENQVMGSYKGLDDDVLLMASVRGVKKDGTKTAAPRVSDGAKMAVEAKQNQDFNRDDLDELKEKQIIGEALDGQLVILPQGTGLAETAAPQELSFAKMIIQEENRDRDIVVHRIITSNENLSAKDLSAAKVAFRKKVLEDSPEGTWFQDESGSWTRKQDRTKDQTP